MMITGIPDSGYSIPTVGIYAPTHRNAVLLALMLVLIAVGHFISPDSSNTWRVVHVGLEKAFFIPVVLAAIWYGRNGALLVAGLVSLAYVPFITVTWSAHPVRNFDHLAALLIMWSAAAVAGTLVAGQRKALLDVAAAHEGALIALVNALDARERNTHLHSLRVRAYSVKLGEYLKMPKRSLDTLARGALLHDIGKIGVPDSLLLKEGPLTDDEWGIMKKHPEIGGRILETIPFLNDAAVIVRTHHEKYDGSGYPQGLSGSRIPLASRIFAVVDALDALLSDRSYRAALSFVDARQRIVSARGSHFDPEIVSVFETIPESEWRLIAKETENYPQPGK